METVETYQEIYCMLVDAVRKMKGEFFPPEVRQALDVLERQPGYPPAAKLASLLPGHKRAHALREGYQWLNSPMFMAGWINQNQARYWAKKAIE